MRQNVSFNEDLKKGIGHDAEFVLLKINAERHW